MKKILILSATILVLLCGCQASEDTNASDYGDDISKAQEIAVISSDTLEISDFILALNLDQWELKSLPDEASEIGSFGLAQEETIKLGQTDTHGTLYDIATITLYSGDYIGFEIGGLDLTFKVNEDTADYLNGYFE